MLFSELTKHFEKSQLQIYSFHGEHCKDIKWLSHKSLEREIIELLKRRPCRVDDVSKSLGISLATTTNLLEKLACKNLIAVEVRKGKKYHFIRNKW